MDRETTRRNGAADPVDAAAQVPAGAEPPAGHGRKDPPEPPAGSPAEHTGAEPPLAPPELSRASLRRLLDAGGLTPAAWEEAMRFCGFRPDARQWRAYWRHLFLLGGALFLAAGIIFFFAWNWADMHRFLRMALVGLVVAGTGLGAVWRGPDTASGRVLLLTCGICVGPMLAVFGQTYQTGAELWELFRVWTVVLVALAIPGRQPALWFTAWLAGNVFVMLWLGRSLPSPLEALGMFSLLPECVVALALAVAAWEWFAHRASRRGGSGQSWLRSRWFPRLLFFDLTVRLTAYLCLRLFDGHWLSRPSGPGTGQEIILLALALVVAGVSWHWHRKRMPDLFMPACLVSACAVLLVAALLRMEFLFHADIMSVLLWGLLLVGITAGVAKILLSLQRRMEAEHGGREASHWKVSGRKVTDGAGTNAPGPAVPVMDFCAPSRPLPGWRPLKAHLQEEGLLPPGAGLLLPPGEDAAPPAPWYVRAILAVGGWVASVVLLVFLGLAVLMGGGNEGASLLGASLVPLFAAAFALKGSGVFVKNFGFSLALAGSAGMCIGVGLMTESAVATQFASAVLLAGLCAVLDSAAFRFLAGLCVVLLGAWGILGVALHGVDFRDGGADFAAAYRRGSSITAAWWTGTAFAIAACVLREGEWRASARGKILEPFCFGAYGGMMAALILALSTRFGLAREFGLHGFLPPSAFPVGLGAAAGLVFFVKSLTGPGRLTPAQLAALACAGLCLPLGWFLPGVALAAFGLTLSRFTAGAVMQGCTAAFLFAYMVYYYYFLGMPLLHKSALLGATGLVLLALAWALGRFGSRLETEAGHA